MWINNYNMLQDMPEVQEISRNPDGTFPKGVSGNPNGRPKGKTLKEFAREYLMNLPDDEKLEYLSNLPRDIVWKMAEGNPKQDTDVTSAGERIIIMPAELIEKNDPNHT